MLNQGTWHGKRRRRWAKKQSHGNKFAFEGSLLGGDVQNELVDDPTSWDWHQINAHCVEKTLGITF